MTDVAELNTPALLSCMSCAVPVADIAKSMPCQERCGPPAD